MERLDNGYYRYGEIEDGRKHGEYGVIQGKVANDNGHKEWRPFIGLMKSKWFVYRHFDDGGMTSVCPKTYLGRKNFDRYY